MTFKGSFMPEKFMQFKKRFQITILSRKFEYVVYCHGWEIQIFCRNRIVFWNISFSRIKLSDRMNQFEQTSYLKKYYFAVDPQARVPTAVFDTQLKEATSRL